MRLGFAALCAWNGQAAKRLKGLAAVAIVVLQAVHTAAAQAPQVTPEAASIEPTARNGLTTTPQEPRSSIIIGDFDPDFSRRPESGWLDPDDERPGGYGHTRQSYKTVCVRLCDGFYFPVSFATTTDRFGQDEAHCRAKCGSPARLYFYPNPGGAPEDMRDRSGRAYLDLKTAFLYRTKFDQTCTCRPHPWTREAAARHAGYETVPAIADVGGPGTPPSAELAEAGDTLSRFPAPDQQEVTRLLRLEGDPDKAVEVGMDDELDATSDLTPERPVVPRRQARGPGKDVTTDEIFRRNFLNHVF